LPAIKAMQHRFCPGPALGGRQHKYHARPTRSAVKCRSVKSARAITDECRIGFAAIFAAGKVVQNRFAPVAVVHAGGCQFINHTTAPGSAAIRSAVKIAALRIDNHAHGSNAVVACEAAVETFRPDVGTISRKFKYAPRFLNAPARGAIEEVALAVPNQRATRICVSVRSGRKSVDGRKLCARRKRGAENQRGDWPTTVGPTKFLGKCNASFSPALKYVVDSRLAGYGTSSKTVPPPFVPPKGVVP
jgi:hypothetical protein